MWKLIDMKTKRELKAGDEVETFRCEKVTLRGWSFPETKTKGGRVILSGVNGDSGSYEYFPVVIGATFVEEE